MKSKGLIVKWGMDATMKEGETAPMTFGHENPAKARALASCLRTRWKKTFNDLCNIVNVKPHHWIVVAVTDMDYTNKRTGRVTTERIKSTFHYYGTLLDATDTLDKVQLEDSSDRTKKLRSRKITCYCKD